MTNVIRIDRPNKVNHEDGFGIASENNEVAVGNTADEEKQSE